MTNTFFKSILLFSVLVGIGFSQFKTPVTISSEVENSVRPGEVAHVLVKASMDDEWHIYALENAVTEDGSIINNLEDKQLPFDVFNNDKVALIYSLFDMF